MLRKCVFLSVIIVMILSLWACGGAAPVEEEEEVTPVEDEEIITPAEEEAEEVEAAPLITRSMSRSVKVTLDSGRSAGAVISADGGIISATAADGSRFTLSFPVKSVLGAKEVTLTPVSAMEGLPLSGRLVAAVQLEPEGLRLFKPATLTIELPDPVPAENLIGFAYSGSGEGFHLTSLEVSGATLTFQLMHFSGVGAGTGIAADYEILAHVIDGNLAPETHAQEQIAYVNATYKDGEAATDATMAILRVWFRASVLPGLNGADTWGTLMYAKSELDKWLGYYFKLEKLLDAGLDPGLDQDYDSALEALGDAIQRVLHKENALVICNTGPEDEKVHRNRLHYLQYLVGVSALNRDDLVWGQDALGTVSIGLKAVVPGIAVPLTNPRLKWGETSEGRFELVATLTDPGGFAYDMSELPCVSIRWESCCPFTLGVDQNGVVTGRNPGTRCVEASITGIDAAHVGTGTAEVMVTVTGMVHVVASIYPEFVEGTEGRLAEGILFPGESVRLIVTTKDKSGKPVPWPDDWDVELVFFGPQGRELEAAPDFITVSEWEFSDQYSGAVSPTVLFTAVAAGWVQPHVYVSGAGWSQDYGWKDIAVLPDITGTWKGRYDVEDCILDHVKQIYDKNWIRLTITRTNEGHLLQLSGELAWTHSWEIIECREIVEDADDCWFTGAWEVWRQCYTKTDQTITIPYDSSLAWDYQLWQDGQFECIGYTLISAIHRYADPNPPDRALLQPDVFTCNNEESPGVRGFNLVLYTFDHIQGQGGLVLWDYWNLYR